MHIVFHEICRVALMRMEMIERACLYSNIHFQVSPELSTGRMDPRVGSSRVGSKKGDPWTTPWVSPSILAVAVYDIIYNWRQFLKSRCEPRANFDNDKLLMPTLQLIVYYLYSLQLLECLSINYVDHAAFKHHCMDWHKSSFNVRLQQPTGQVVD